MGSVFAMQGIGQFAAGMIALIVTSGFKESLLTATTVAKCNGVCGLAVDKMWRIIIGFGVGYNKKGTDDNNDFLLLRFTGCPGMYRPLLPPHYPRNPSLHLRCCPRYCQGCI